MDVKEIESKLHEVQLQIEKILFDYHQLIGKRQLLMELIQECHGAIQKEADLVSE